MKLLDITHCARPVLFANDDRDYPYSVGGTAFVVKFRGRSFVVTAKHVLNLGSFNPQQLRIQYRPDSKEFLPLREVYLANAADDADADQYDIAVVELDSHILRDDLYGQYKPYELLGIDRATIYSARGAYIYRSYPIAMRHLDFQNKHVEQGSVTSRAEYWRRTPYAAIRELRLLDLKPLQSIDGLSGSPVFQVHNEDDGRHSREAFAGMMIRGTIESRKVFLIEHRKIIEVLTDIADGKVDDVQGLRGSH